MYEIQMQYASQVERESLIKQEVHTIRSGRKMQFQFPLHSGVLLQSYFGYLLLFVCPFPCKYTLQTFPLKSGLQRSDEIPISFIINSYKILTITGCVGYAGELDVPHKGWSTTGARKRAEESQRKTSCSRVAGINSQRETLDQFEFKKTANFVC